jgi:3-oxoacyl-[acyl-carrier protein] reductase
MGAQDDKLTNHHQKILEKTPLGRMAHPSEIASLALYFTSEDASFINGSICTIDGGLTSHVGVS